MLASFTWLGTASTDWANQANWDIGDASPGDDGVPGAADSALINDVANDPLLDSARSLGALTGTGIIDLGANTLTVGALNTSTAFNGTISGTGGITKVGTNVFTLGGAAANTYSGLTTVSGGRLNLAKTSGNAIGGDLTITSALVSMTGSHQIADTSNVVMSGSGSVFNGTGINSGHVAGYTETLGSVTVTGGTFQTGPSANLTVTGAGSFTGGVGNTIFLGNSGARISFGTLNLTGMTATAGGTVSTANSFTMYGANSSTQGTVTVGAGGLNLNGSFFNLRQGGAGNLGSRLVLNGDVTTSGTAPSSIIVDSAGGTNGSRDILLSNIAGAFTRTVTVGAGGADLSINVPITNGSATTASLTKAGLGTLNLGAASSYNGTTTVSTGILRINVADALPTATALTLGNVANLNTATFDLNGFNQTLGGLSSVGTMPITVTNTGAMATLTVNNAAGNTTYAGAITGALNLAKTSAGQLTLTGATANTYTGTTTVSAGTLTLSRAALAIPGDLDISNAGKVTITTNNQIADTSAVTMSGAGSVFNGTAPNVGVGTVTDTIGSLNVTGGTFNAGLGAWTITGAGSFTGGAGNTIYVGNSGSNVSFGSLSLTAMNATAGGTVGTSNSFTVYGNSTFVRTSLTVGAGGLLLDGSTLNLRRGGASALGSRLILNGNVTTVGLAASSIAEDTAGGTTGLIGIELSSTAAPATRTFTLGQNLSIGVPIVNGQAAPGSIIQAGPAALTLSAANTYTGTTAVDNGQLTIATGGNLAGTSGITVGSVGNTAVLLVTSAASLSLGAGNVSLGNGGTGTLQQTTTSGIATIGGGILDSGVSALNIDTGSLVVTNGLSVDSLRVGVATTAGAAATGTLTVNGGAVVAGSNGAEMYIGRRTIASSTATTSSGTVDFSNAASVSLLASNLLLGQYVPTAQGNVTGDNTRGSLLLSTSGINTIAANTITVGVSTDAGPGNAANLGTEAANGNRIVLGNALNNINADTLSVGSLKSSGLIRFAGIGGTLNLAGSTGATTSLLVGNNLAQNTGIVTSGVVNLTGGTFNGTLSNVILGRHGGGNGSGSGSLTMDAGLVTATSITLGTPHALAATASATPANTSGTITLNGGTLSVAGTIQNSVGTRTTSGTANINLFGGTLQFVTLNRVASAPFNFNFNSGRIQNVAGQNLTDNNVTINLLTAATHTFEIDGGQVGTITSTATIAGVGALTKAGTGTLTLSGLNTYTGATNVNAGVLAVNNGVGTGAILDTAGPVNVALGATLQLLANETVSSYVGAGDPGVGTNDSLLALGANTLTTVGDATIANVSTAAGGGIVAGGAIIDGDDDVNITGPNVFLRAATGIGAGSTLETSVSAIQLFNTTSGEINVLNSVGGLLTVSDLRTLGFGARNDGGATTVVNSSPLTIAANSISVGNVTFTATDDNDAPLLDDDLTINGGVTVGSTTANVFLNAGDDALINGNVSAALQVTIGVDVGDAELPAGTDATTGGVLTIANAAVITTPLAGVGGGTYLNGNDDHDTFNLAPQSTTEFFMNGNLPVGTSPGDTLNLDISAAVNPLLTLGGIGAGTWTFGAPLRQVVYTSIEDVNANAAYHLALDANNTPFGNTNVDDHLTLSRSGADFVLSRTGDAIAPDDNDVGIVFQGDFATILSFTYLGSNDRDFLTINDLGGLVNFSGLAPGAGDNTNLAGQAEFFFDGGGNNDTLIFALTGPSASQTYAFGTNSGSTPSNTGEVLSSSNAVDLQTYFANVELVQRTGAGATPGALTVLGSDVADALSIAANLADTRVSMGVGYTPFDFSGDNFTSLNVNALAGADSLNLVSLGSGQTNDPAINLHGQGLFADDGAVDTLRVQSTSGNTGVVTLRGGLGGDLFQLFDAAPTVDFIAGPVVVDGSGGDMTFAVDRLEINDSGDLTGDTVALNALNGTDPDYVLTGLNASGVTFRNIDNLDYTGTSDADNINSQLTPTTTPHDLEAVILRGNGGNDQFRVFTSDQIGGTSPLPSGLASGVTSVSLFGDAGLDTFGETPAGLVGTGAMNVGLVVAPTTQLIRPSTTTAITINGGIPTNPLPAPVGDIIGDTLNLDITSIPNTAPVVVAAGSSGVLNSAGQPVAWSEIEDLNLVDQGKLTNVQVGDLFARTTAANDLIQFSRNNTVAQPHRVRLRINSTFGDYNVSNKTIVYAGDGADYVTQANLTVSAEFYGEGGNDLLYGATNNDWLVGGLDNDSVNGGNGDNVLWGDNAPASTDVVPPQDSPVGGNDTLSGGTGNDVIYGGGGNDRLGGFDSNDYLHGGFGDDIADGGFGDDRVYGGAGNDQLAGYLGNDLLVGEAGNDILNGGSGNDVLIGGTGEDNMSGEFGNDLLITGSVANEHSTWTSVASVGPFSAATYSNATDNDAALLALLNIWGTSNLRTGLATITHDGVDDDVYGKLGDDDFCWEAADVADQGPTALSPPDFQVPGNGTDERFGPTM
ncbi:beta strand repeat-containing protein [Anatilimnocola sp. NA78]|uniref:beta strand repeat-containing protein n=1 Tax=Anatilimnocola sp. NA78 TaxID=3415683 RepID=UPI003CE5C2C8